MVVALEAGGVVKIACVAGEVGRLSHVKRLTGDALQLLERRLAAARAADDDERRGHAIDGMLRIIEGQRLVEEVDDRPLLAQITHCSRLRARLGNIGICDPRLIDRGSAQEARFAVVVIAHDLEHQRADFLSMSHERKDQPIGMTELRSVEALVTGKLLHLRSAEITAADSLRRPRVLLGES
ncbi:MAG: hypothetical protein ACRD4G_00610 [Bryobacteraceae bacterium]